jgi:hypothetical protein
MKTLIIDDIDISITVKYYFNLLGERKIVECTNNLTNKRINLRPWQGTHTDLAAYIIKTLNIVIKKQTLGE